MILIAFRHSDTRLFSRLVTGVRGGDSAHVEAAMPMGELSLCVSSSFVDGGVRGKVIDITNGDKWRIYKWDKPHRDPLAWLAEHDGDGYDLRGLIGILAPPVGHHRTKRFCSESVAEILDLPYPETFDLVALERFVYARAPRVEWSGVQWVEAVATVSTEH